MLYIQRVLNKYLHRGSDWAINCFIYDLRCMYNYFIRKHDKLQAGKFNTLVKHVVYWQQGMSGFVDSELTEIR